MKIVVTKIQVGETYKFVATLFDNNSVLVSAESIFVSLAVIKLIRKVAFSSAWWYTKAMKWLYR